VVGRAWQGAGAELILPAPGRPTNGFLPDRQSIPASRRARTYSILATEPPGRTTVAYSVPKLPGSSVPWPPGYRWVTVASPSWTLRIAVSERTLTTLADNVGQHSLAMIGVHFPISG
jgi:hypothetical protein